MAKSIILTTDECSDLEREYAFHRFREDGRVVDIASVEGEMVTDDRGGNHETSPIAACPVQDYDIVVLPTGWEIDAVNEEILRWLDSYLTNVDSGVLALSGTAVGLLTRLDTIDMSERTVAAAPEVHSAIEATGATVQEELVTVDGRLVTSRNTSALPFFVVAARSNAAIPQVLADRAHERANWKP
jgi:putative intracellular protease/amidase